MVRLFLIAILLCISFGAPGIADTSSLIRLTDREDLFGWEAVGRINIGNNGYCTGTLIDNDLVLTAAHCVYDKRTGALYPPEHFTFNAGLRDGKAIAISQGLRVVAHKSYAPRAGTTKNNIRHDVALIQLANPITSFAAPAFKLHSGNTKGADINVVSYGKGRDAALSWQRKCNVLARHGGILVFNCNVTFGSSGAPVLVKEGRNFRILSLISSGGQMEGKTISFGMELPQIVSRLKKDLIYAPASTTKQPVTQLRMLSAGDGRKTSGAKFIKN
jgi:protease YdgD